MAVEDLRARQRPMCGLGDLPGVTKPLERLPNRKRHGVLFHQVISAISWVMQDQDVGRHRVLIGSSNERDKSLLGAGMTSSNAARQERSGARETAVPIRLVSQPSPLSQDAAPESREGVPTTSSKRGGRQLAAQLASLLTRLAVRPGDEPSDMLIVWMMKPSYIVPSALDAAAVSNQRGKLDLPSRRHAPQRGVFRLGRIEAQPAAPARTDSSRPQGSADRRSPGLRHNADELVTEVRELRRVLALVLGDRANIDAGTSGPAVELGHYPPTLNSPDPRRLSRVVHSGWGWLVGGEAPDGLRGISVRKEGV